MLICLFALLISTGLSWFFYNRWDEVTDQYREVLGQQYESSRQLLQIQDELNRIHPDLEVMRDPEYRVYTLEPYDNGREVRCRIYWNPETGEAMLDPIDLPEPEKGMAYRIDCIRSGEPAQTLKLVKPPVNRDQLMPLGNVLDVTRWTIAYGQSDSTTSVNFLEVAGTR
jgi:hypothetical protein